MADLKSFWAKPQGTTGMLVISGITVIAGGLILANIEAIIKLLEDTIYAGCLAGGILLSVALLMNNRFRFLCRSVFESAMEGLTSIWIPVNAIGILKNYLREMSEKLKKIEGFISQLSGQIEVLRRDIDNRKINIKSFLKLASAAQSRQEMDIAQVQSGKAAREKEYVERRLETLARIQGTEENLSHMKRNLDLLREDTEHRVGLLVDEYKAVRSARNAVRGAEELIQGDTAKEMFDKTCDWMVQDIGTKLGEMDRFMEVSHGTFATMDLQNDVFNADGLKLLAEWEKGGLLSYEKDRNKVRVGEPVKARVGTDPSVDALEAAEMRDAQQGDRPSSFSKIFERK